MIYENTPRLETERLILRKLEENRAGYRRKYNLRRLIEIFMGACNGVAFAHRHGILHSTTSGGTSGNATSTSMRLPPATGT